MRYTLILLLLTLIIKTLTYASSKDTLSAYPNVTIKNKDVKLKLYLPDKEKGYYRGTRFDWTGMIYSLEYKGHQYFGEWSKTRNPVSSSDVTGPVNGFLEAGLGYKEALVGGEFIRIGVGVLEKADEASYGMFKTYKIIDNGTWKTKKGKYWIEFYQEIKRESGWAFVYCKRIKLASDRPGFIMSCSLKNNGTKTIETDQFNHNFFIIDQAKPGPDYSVRFPFPCKLDNNPRNRAQSAVNIAGDDLVFSAQVERDVWMSIKGYSDQPADNQFEIINKKTGAGVRVQGDQPLYDLNFYANKITLCPETFIYLKIAPGEEKKWSSNYSFFTVEK